MELIRGIQIVDLSLFLVKQKTLILADTQLGYEESVSKRGILLPRFQFKDIVKRIGSIIDVTEPKTIILNGDIKHEFSGISRTEWDNVTKLLDLLSANAELMIIEGNHDNMLSPILKKNGLVMKDHVKIDDIYICHGHRIPVDKDFVKANTIIIGHEHPGVALREKGRVEKFKCFLLGKYKDKTLIVMPSFNSLTVGTDVLAEKLLSPFLQQSIGDFEVYVTGKEILNFGKIKGLV